MSTLFKTSPVDGHHYIEVKYIEYVPPNPTIKVNLTNHVWSESQEDADKLVKSATEIRGLLAGEIKKQGLSYDPIRIMAEKITAIDNWGSGLMVISKFSIEEMVTWMVSTFDKQYTDIKHELMKILEESKKGNYSYSKHYQDIEKYDRLNKYWEFGFEDLVSVNEANNALDNLLETTTKLLDVLKKANEQTSK